MAVGRMLRVTAFGHRSALDETVSRLQHAGVLQISAEQDLPLDLPVTDEDRQHELEEWLGRVDFVRDFLGRFHEPDQAFATFVSEKVHLSEDEFLALEYDAEFDELYRECEQLSGRLAEIERERERLRTLRHELEPWEPLHLQIGRWAGTRRVALFTGTIGTTRSTQVRQELREAVAELSVQEVGSVGTREAWVIMVIPEFEDEVRAILSRTDFEEVSFPDLKDYPAEEIARIDDSIVDYDADEESALVRSAELADSYRDALCLGEALRARHAALTVRGDFGSTRRTFMLRGWVPERQVADLDTAVGDLAEVDIELTPPAEDDNPPVILHNRKWLWPFETITDLYGRPRYGEADPTGPLSLWFIFFFGICLGDAGYGLALFIIAWLIKHRLDVADSVKQFMDLLMYGGVAAVLVGIMAGSYFAIDPALLPTFMQKLIVFDFVGDVQTVLIASVVLGVLHIFWGVALKIRAMWLAGDQAGAIMDEFSTYLMWGILPVLVFAPASWRGSAALGIAAVVVLLKGHVLMPPYGLKTPLGILTGLYGTYDTFMGHVSDFLSYTRLAALGMASALVGQVMNLIAGLFPTSGRLAIIGVLAAIFVLIVGHGINLVMSLLGAFVHPLRLQYVEFFSKFYEGGGSRFAPFDYGTKSLVLRRESVQEEGG